MITISETRRQLLVELESIIGNSFYNSHIQNHGPGGVREADGRGLRYPVTFFESDGTKMKVKDHRVPKSVPTEIFLSGYYAVGANQLDVMASLNRVIQHLEKKYGLAIEAKEQDAAARAGEV